MRSGGTPEDADKARDMIGTLKPEGILATLAAPRSPSPSIRVATARSGAVGFCWGGGQVNALAVADPDLAAGVAYYGRQPAAADVPKITGAAASCTMPASTSASMPASPTSRQALKANGKTYELYVYEGANHAFNNDTNAARYNKEAADLAWSRTVAFLKKHAG